MLIILLGIIIIVWVVPNFGNDQEEEAFSESNRLQRAREKNAGIQSSDSVEVIPGLFYKRGKTHTWFLGESYRELWQTPVTVPVLYLSNKEGGLDTVKFSGSQQTIGIDVKDKRGRRWAIRSVNKDQSKALPSFLQGTIIRPLFRDQGAALNPYGALVVPVLAAAIGVHHTNPQLYYFPYEEANGTYNNRMAGRLVIMEEEADDTWAGSPRFNYAVDLLDTEEMFDTSRVAGIPIDTLLYARSRLLDLLISDWDRHEGNWEWAVIEKQEKTWIQPVPVDRDMAFYNFNEGAINKVALLFNSKFQSFTSNYENVAGLMVQAAPLDRAILKNLTKDELQNQALFIQAQITPQVIEEAFRKYPPEVFELIGKEHIEIFSNRLSKLPEAVEQFYLNLHEE